MCICIFEGSNVAQMYPDDSDYQPNSSILKRKNPLLAKVEKPKDRTAEQWRRGLKKSGFFQKYSKSSEDKGDEDFDGEKVDQMFIIVF